MKRTITALALAAAMAAAAPRQADGQSDQITARATIAAALTVTAGAALDFQTVIPTFTKTVAVSDVTAGTFTLSGGADAEVSLTFTLLPANLAGPGGNLPITYTGVHNTANDPVAGATAFTPSAGVAGTNLSGSGQLYVFLGGTVDAALQSVAGLYTGTVELSAAYTGN